MNNPRAGDRTRVAGPETISRPHGPATPTEIEINPEFAHALERMHSGKGNLFITGKAGTGKSTLLEHFRAHAERKPVVLAPTGVAALNVRGQTIHRFFRFGIDVTPLKLRESRKRPRNANLYRNLRTIIIDEVSMVRADLLDCVDIFLRKHGPRRRQPFGGVQMIFVGDLYQLPPVVTGEEREIFRTLYDTPYFFSAEALQSANLEIIELEKVYRQKDSRFVEILNHVRNDTVDEADIAALNARLDPSYSPAAGEFCVTLTTTNRNADAINDRKLESLPGKTLVSIAEIEGDFGREYHPTTVELAIKPGAQIMLLNSVIENAIARKRRIEMTYLKPDDTRSERTILPQRVGTESYRGKEFLGMQAFCLLRQDERMFRVDRILRLAAVE